MIRSRTVTDCYGTVGGKENRPWVAETRVKKALWCATCEYHASITLTETEIVVQLAVHVATPFITQQSETMSKPPMRLSGERYGWLCILWITIEYSVDRCCIFPLLLLSNLPSASCHGAIPNSFKFCSGCTGPNPKSVYVRASHQNKIHLRVWLKMFGHKLNDFITQSGTKHSVFVWFVLLWI